MATTLITGGLGYVGTNIARALVANGERPVLFDLASISPPPGNLKQHVLVTRGDLSSFAEVFEAVHTYQPDCIFHLGAMISMAAEANPWAAYGANANGTYHVLEAARIFNVGPVVFLTGIATYGPGSPHTVNEDTFQSNPFQIYAATKIFGERLGEYYHHRFRVDFRAASLPAICGPGRREGLAAYPSLMVHESVRGRPCHLPVSENTLLPFIYIRDVVRCLQMMRTIDQSLLRRRIYSISGFSITAGEMAEVVRRRIPGAQIEFAADENIIRMVSSMPKYVDDSRARADWGWSAEYDWEKSVEDFIATMESQPELYP